MTSDDYAKHNWQTFQVGDRVIIPGFSDTREAVITADLTYIGKTLGHLYGVHIARDERDGGDLDLAFPAGFLRPAPTKET